MQEVLPRFNIQRHYAPLHYSASVCRQFIGVGWPVPSLASFQPSNTIPLVPRKNVYSRRRSLMHRKCGDVVAFRYTRGVFFLMKTLRANEDPRCDWFEADATLEFDERLGGFESRSKYVTILENIFKWLRFWVVLFVRVDYLLITQVNCGCTNGCCFCKFFF